MSGLTDGTAILTNGNHQVKGFVYNNSTWHQAMVNSNGTVDLSVILTNHLSMSYTRMEVVFWDGDSWQRTTQDLKGTGVNSFLIDGSEAQDLVYFRILNAGLQGTQYTVNSLDILIQFPGNINNFVENIYNPNFIEDVSNYGDG